MALYVYFTLLMFKFSGSYFCSRTCFMPKHRFIKPNLSAQPNGTYSLLFEAQGRKISHKFLIMK